MTKVALPKRAFALWTASKVIELTEVKFFSEEEWILE
jgi:hypothetical protein